MLTWGGGRDTREIDVRSQLASLEGALEVVTLQIRRPDLGADVHQRLRNLQDDLASHALAARVLVTSGASADAVVPVLRRAAALLDEERRRGLPVP